MPLPPVVVDDDVVRAVLVDVAGSTDLPGDVAPVVVVASRGRVVVVTFLGAAVVTGTRTAGTSWLGGAGSGRTQR